MNNKGIYIHSSEHASTLAFAHVLCANRNQPKMSLNLAKMYERGEPFFSETDWEKALYYHQQAILGGVYESYYHLARWYCYGVGPYKRDAKRAKSLLHDGAEHDDAHCHFLLGLWYDQGWFDERLQPLRAVRAYESAARLGLAESWRQLARCYVIGQPYFRKPDIEQAKRCRYYFQAQS